MSIELGQSRVPDGLRIYAVGDVHGCLQELLMMLAMIERDLVDNPVNDHRIVFVGDYQDRGPESKMALLTLMCLTARDNRVICLRGNHDTALLEFLTDPYDDNSVFFRNGGADTLRSYGVRVVGDAPTGNDLTIVHGFAEALVNGHHRAFLAGLPLTCAFGDYFFCHAGVRPEVPLDKQTENDLTWIRHDFIDHREPFEKVIIHGHTSAKEIDVRNNRINIDTRCHATGVLSCVVLQDSDYRFLQTGTP